MWSKKQILTKGELEELLGGRLDSVRADIDLLQKFQKIWKTDRLSPELKSEIEHWENYILTEMNVNYFASPEELLAFQELCKKPPPNKSGVYGWYFNKLNPYVLRQSKIYVKPWWFSSKWFLLYIGRGNDLNRRIIEMHFKNADVSSLRLSLGCLLVRKLKICLRKRPRPNDENDYAYTFGDEGEEKLSHWMAKNSRLSWIVSNDYERVEEEAIEKYKPPLCSIGNPEPFKPLEDLKSCLKELAVLEGENPQWKEVKQAYKAFLKDCKLYK